MDYQHDPYEDTFAGELVERHRNIHSCSATPPTPKRPPLTVSSYSIPGYSGIHCEFSLLSKNKNQHMK